MKIAFLTGKIVVLIFWAAVIISLFPVFPAIIATILRWAGVFVLCAHSVEVILIARYLRDHVGEPKLSKLMVLVFGLFYVVPFIQEIKSREA